MNILQYDKSCQFFVTGTHCYVYICRHKLYKMAKAIYLAQIRNRMESIQKEYNALSEAYQILQRVGSARGRKAKIPTLQEMLGGDVKMKTGKRGRPPGAKNKPGAKKPGPKPKAVKVIETVSVPKITAENRKPMLKVKSGKRGRPAKSAKPTKPTKVEKPQTVITTIANNKKPIVKASAKSVIKAVAKPAAKASVKPAGKKAGKRNRIPNLAEKIQEIVGKNSRFTTNSVITDKLAGLYPGKSRSDLGKYISVILANMKARKELAVVTQDAKGNKMRSGLWGLPNWFEGSKPKAEFLK